MNKKLLEQFLPDKKYYEFNTRGTCQVVVTEKVMREISEIIHKADLEIKNLLHNAKSEDVLKYDWSLSNLLDKNGKILKQQTFAYEAFKHWASLEQRINRITLGVPKHIENFYVIKNEEELETVKELIRVELEKDWQEEKREEIV